MFYFLTKKSLEIRRWHEKLHGIGLIQLHVMSWTRDGDQNVNWANYYSRGDNTTGNTVFTENTIKIHHRNWYV